MPPILSPLRESLSQSPKELSRKTSQKRATVASGSITPDVFGNISRRKAIGIALKKHAPEFDGPGKSDGSAASRPEMSSPRGNFVPKIRKMADPKIGKTQRKASKSAG